LLFYCIFGQTNAVLVSIRFLQQNLQQALTPKQSQQTSLLSPENTVFYFFCALGSTC